MQVETMKKRSILHHILLLFGTVALLSGCSKSQTDDDPAGPEPQMSLLQEKQTIGSQGGPLTVEIQCNVEYEVSLPDDPDWLRETASGTVTNGIHRFEADPNDEYDSRSTRIVFSNAAFGLSRTFTVTQMQKNAILISEERYIVEAEGGTLDFEINTNVDFEVNVSEEWIRQVQKSQTVRGLTQKSLHFIIDPNPDNDSREAVITLTAEDAEQSILVHQAGLGQQSRLRIIHTNPTFVAPILRGAYFLGGTVSWGDESTEEYREEISHTYKEEGEYTVTIETQGAEEFTLPDLVNVSALDLSQF